MANPRYLQIAEQLRTEIESGHLSSGQQLPTETELMEEHDASRNTIRDAIKILQSRGLVNVRPGQGTFVTQKIEPTATVLSGGAEITDTSELDVFTLKVQDRNRTRLVTAPRVEIQRAWNDLATQLGIAEGEPVISRYQQTSVDGIPWSVQTSFYPMEFVNRGALRLIEAVNIEEGTTAYLEDSIGVKQVGYRDVITVREADRNETAFFDLPDHGQVSVFEIRRTTFDQTPHPIRLTISVFPVDRNKLIYEERTGSDAVSVPQATATTESDDSTPA